LKSEQEKRSRDSKYLFLTSYNQVTHVTQRMRNVLVRRLHRENAGLAWHRSDRTYTKI